jgi:hypothetical protein
VRVDYLLYDEMFGWLEKCTVKTEPLTSMQQDIFDKLSDFFNLYPNSFWFRYALYYLQPIQTDICKTCN